MRKKGINWVVMAICVFCNAACAGIWLYLGFLGGEGVDWFYVAIGVMWLLAALVWCIRLMKRPRNDQGPDPRL